MLLACHSIHLLSRHQYHPPQQHQHRYQRSSSNIIAHTPTTIPSRMLILFPKLPQQPPPFPLASPKRLLLQQRSNPRTPLPHINQEHLFLSSFLFRSSLGFTSLGSSLCQPMRYLLRASHNPQQSYEDPQQMAPHSISRSVSPSCSLAK